MSRAPNPQGAHKAHRRRIYYADPDRVGKSRCSECFPSHVKPKRVGYQQTQGPCWVCQAAQQKRTLYLVISGMADDLEDVAHSLERLCVRGFGLAELLARKTGGVCVAPRQTVEQHDGESLSAFRAAWAESAQKLSFPAKGAGPWGSIYGQVALGILDLQPGSLIDPRMMFRDGDPTARPEVHAAHLLGSMGRLAYLADLLLQRTQELRRSLTRNHGDDSDEPLRLLRQRLGATQLRLVVSALEFLEPSARLNDRGKERALAISGKLRQRTFQGKPLPDE